MIINRIINGRAFFMALTFSAITFVLIPTAFSQLKAPTKDFKSLKEKAEYYKNRFGKNCLSEKIVDNRGAGFDELYGVRNLRTILYGVAYRGGANNAYHKTNTRDNKNPLPEDGLQNLAKFGFSKSVYLYSTNFKGKRELTGVNERTGATDTMLYVQNSGIGEKNIKDIIKTVYEIIKNPTKGPVYLHCWNGWHQSGYVSAALLKQFCGFSDQSAYDYWMKNTDGVNKGYENVKKLVREFKPIPEYSITPSEKEAICPCDDSKK